MRKSRLFVAPSVISIAVLVLVGPNGGAAAAPSPSAPASTSGLDAYSREISPAAQADATFTGMLVDHSAIQIVLYVTDPSAPQWTRLASSSAYRIALQRTASSMRDLMVRTQAVGPLIDTLNALGVNVSHYGPHFQTGELEVGIRNYSLSNVQQVKSRLGADVLVTDASAEALPEPASRAYDTSPFYGGDFTTADNGSTRTARRGFRCTRRQPTATTTTCRPDIAFPTGVHKL
jgi:hypothetical protein